ncbi:MAG: hypothetical protein V4506_19345 [Bacteroidota bacterium]
MRSTHFIIGKQIVDEAMWLVKSGLTDTTSDIRVCKCVMSTVLQKIIHDFEHNKPLGMIRIDFVVNKSHKAVLVNADYALRNHKLSNV